jgi:hypothetical protein
MSWMPIPLATKRMRRLAVRRAIQSKAPVSASGMGSPLAERAPKTTRIAALGSRVSDS